MVDPKTGKKMFPKGVPGFAYHSAEQIANCKGLKVIFITLLATITCYQLAVSRKVDSCMQIIVETQHKFLSRAGFSIDFRSFEIVQLVAQ